jgi:hypothetical protein
MIRIKQFRYDLNMKKPAPGKKRQFLVTNSWREDKDLTEAEGNFLREATEKEIKHWLKNIKKLPHRHPKNKNWVYRYYIYDLRGPATKKYFPKDFDKTKQDLFYDGRIDL